MAKVEILGPQIHQLRKVTFALKRNTLLDKLRSMVEDAGDAAAESESQKTVLLCGGEKLVRAGLQALILQRSGLRVTAEVNDTTELVGAASRLQPNVIVVDLGSMLVDDSQLMRVLRASAPRARVLAVAPTRSQEWRRRAMQIGAVGLVTQQDGASVFLDSIEKIADPKPVAVAPQSTAANDVSSAREALSARETDVARLVCQGMRNEQIGRQLFISEATVRHHLTAIFAKRQVASRAELIVDAHRSAFLG